MFPQELVQSVILELLDDRQSLFACALVSWAFREMAQKHIFREIAISFDGQGRDSLNVQRLALILQNNPVLSSHVQSLVLQLGDFHFASDNLWLFDRFHNVKKLKLTSRSDYVDWSEMPDKLRNALTLLLRSQSLSCLALHRQNHFPVDFLLRFTNITHLEMEASSASRIPVSPSSNKCPAIASFKAVIYEDYGPSLRAAQAMMDAFAPSLNEATLDYLGYESLPPPDADRVLVYRGFKHLRSLKLILRIQNSTMILIPFCQSLATLSTCGSRQVQLELVIRFRNPVGEPFEGHWLGLDRTLCGMLDTGVIATLIVVLSSYVPDDRGMKALRDIMSGLDARLSVHTISGSQEFL
ncbi:hypothetical protein H0H93_015128 [Arthromyces matolae]|nr:hypothetical protein H0H93_015128 [Arthromyces matolae]